MNSIGLVCCYVAKIMENTLICMGEVLKINRSFAKMLRSVEYFIFRVPW